MTTTERPDGYVEHATYSEALSAFQAELPTVTKSKTGDAGSYKYKYADLADVAKAAHPVLARHGLSFSSKPNLNDEGKFVLQYVLRHDSGGEDGGEFPLPSSGNMQAIGGALTYARRYSLCAITDIVAEEDTDGRDSGEVRTESPRRGRAGQQSSPQRNGTPQRQNGQQAPDTSEVGQARDALQALASEQSHDWIAVRKAFAKQAGEPLANHQNAEFIREFTKSLRDSPEHVLALAAPKEETT